MAGRRDAQAIRQGLSRKLRRAAPAGARRHRIPEEGGGGIPPRRYMVGSVSRVGGRWVLLKRGGVAGSEVRGERVQPRLERMSPRGHEEAGCVLRGVRRESREVPGGPSRLTAGRRSRSQRPATNAP